MGDRRTSTKAKSKAGIARQWGRMVSDWCLAFEGTAAELDAAKAHPRVKARFYEFLRKLAAERANPLLQFLTTVAVVAIQAFDASRYFVEKNQPDGIKFWMGDYFKDYFVPKREGPVAALVLRVFHLLRISRDLYIMAELEGLIEITLGQFYELIKRQPKGPASGEGVLLTNGRANILYIKDINGVTSVVYCRWDASFVGWDVGARSSMSWIEWCDGTQVFSRNSSVA